MKGLDVDVQGRVGDGGLTVRAAFATGDVPTVLVGPNGSGKTSVLLMVLGALPPDSGRVTLDGRVLFDSAARIDVPEEERGLGFVPQGYGIFPHMSVLENVEFAVLCRERRASRRARRDRAMALLEELGIGALSDRRPKTLSGGERQRLALARALAVRPRALLLDEPLAALDAGARRQVRVFLASTLSRLGLPAIVVTHDAQDAFALAERVWVLESGRIVQTGTLSELQAGPASPFVSAFVESARSGEPRSVPA